MSSPDSRSTRTEFVELLEEVQAYQDDLTNRFPDVGIEWEERRYGDWQAFASRLSEIDVSELDENTSADYEVLERELEHRIRRYEHGIHLLPLDHNSGPHSSFVRYPSNQPFETREHYERYLDRLRNAADYFEAARALLRKGIEEGVTPPRSVLDGHDDMIDTYLVDDPTDSELYAPFVNVPASIPDESRDRFREAAKTAITAEVIPSLERFREFLLTEYLPETRSDHSYAELPDGEAYYEHLVRYYTTRDVTPETIHETGLKEVERIRGEMFDVMDETGFEGEFDAFVEYLRTDPRFYADSAEDLLKEAAFIAKKVEGRLPRLFTLDAMPTRPYGIEPVPDDLAPSYYAGAYVRASTDLDAGTFWVNTYDLESRPLYGLPALFLHEAAPGHHHQIAHTNELEDVSEFRKEHMVTAYIEGWALYAERLGSELDAFATPYERFGRLNNEMWRACRLVVDTGIHSKGWSPERAREFMAEHTALSLHNIRTEVDRYIGNPGQALAFKVGEMTIRDLRAEAESRLGDAFDVRMFHETLLEGGPVTLPRLEDTVHSWIDSRTDDGDESANEPCDE